MADPDQAPEALRAGHSHEGEAFNEGPRQMAIAIAGTGEVHFPIHRASPAVQSFFHQGIGQLHGFWYFEAERTFRQIAALDPTCAMAYWGMAMANWENPKRATEFINKAMALREHAGVKDTIWIEAQHRYHTAAGKDDIAKRRQLIRDLEAIIHAYPDDIEAKAFLACRLWQFSRQGLPISSHESVDALLQQVLAKAPMHPAHHYRIHLWDQEKAERALDSAALLASTAPAIAHMWHMPGHIYSKLHRYDDSAWHQQASSRVDHRWMVKHRILPDQIHNYVHNQEWLIRNLQMLGNCSEALAVSRDLLGLPRHPTLNSDTNNKSSLHFGRLRHLETLEQFELWDMALKDLATGDFSSPGNDESVIKTQRLSGIAHFSLGNLTELKQLCDALTAETEKRLTEKSTAQETARSKAQKDKKNRKEIDQAVADAGRKWNEPIRKHKELLEEMRAHLALLEKRKPLSLKGIRRPKHIMARLHLQLGEKEQALRLSKEAVEDAPQQTLPLATRIEILHACDDKEGARSAFTQLRSISSAIDLKTPPFARLASIASDLGMAADWRNKPALREGVGSRPPLHSLGPQCWTPPPAPAFSLPQSASQRISLDSFKGKPVVLLFYLGHGCLHCIEQLNAFAPQYQAFRNAGIEMIAISTDTVNDLLESQHAFTGGGHFPFAILADPAHSSFQAYRAYDDFEKKPLHGTFLIDPQGRVLWQDIAAEPFAKPDFLLKESVRLLQQHSDR